ncbi:M23 family metallopeptidase [Nocardioides plantarum]|uniref:Peptidoglycan DD-metalloendopeptidase family protein n=1 Tax=Nocardioides plantarum TaxID=29299 RepID=A0ABV5KCJ3_9ACTN|nr:M23 family metallopeptidase [Nocardioides plantarum]
MGLVSLAALAAPLAADADDKGDLKNKQREVKGRISAAAADVDESSRAAAWATSRLNQALDRLSDARRTLADVRERLSAARDRDAELQDALTRAELELDRATRAMRAATAAVDKQRRIARNTTTMIYTGGDPELRKIGDLFESNSLKDLGTRQLANQVVTGRQSTIFVDLTEAEDDLTAERATVKRTTLAVEKKRKQAAAHLVELEGLYTESVEAEKTVEGLVREASWARQKADVALARDNRVLGALRGREARIKKQLLAIAERQRNFRGFQGKSGGYLSPPAAGPVTSPFGYRIHPIYGYYSLHNGTDFGTGCGAPLYAAAGGTVIDTYFDSVYGNRLYLSIGKVNGKSLVLIYNHMSVYKASKGERVDRGEVVGLSGTTGWSTGCHLHFTVMEDGVAVNPMKYL